MNNFKELNDELKKIRKNVLIGGPGIVLMSIIAIMLSAIESNITKIFAIFAAILLFGSMFLLGSGLSRFYKLRKTFKEKYIKKMIEEIIPGSKYNPNDGINLEPVKTSGLYAYPDRWHSEDLITGNIEDVQFITSDLVLEERHETHTKEGTEVYYVAYFTGRFFRFEFNKEFEGKLFVMEGKPYNLGGAKKVELESEIFNKKFKTFSVNDLSAFYVLTPHMMESILNLEKNNNGALAFSFDSRYLYFAVNNSIDTFELSLWHDLSEQDIENYKKDINLIFDIVKELRLNVKIFKK